MSNFRKIQRKYKFNSGDKSHKHDYSIKVIAEISSFSGITQHLVNKCRFCSSFYCIPQEGAMNGFVEECNKFLTIIRLHTNHKFVDFKDLVECDTELELPIPLHKITSDGLVSLEHLGFKSELLGILKHYRVSYGCRLEAKCVDSYEFNEEILTVYIPANLVDSIVNDYKELVGKYHKEFQHNFYIYDINGFNNTFFIE